MITYVTCDDVDNAFGNAWTSGGTLKIKLF
ncbi:Uncharacterised protein [Escherichia coli]|uniref:Uncharacterized protein n=1 Tax=Escherichia coli TaxID=562 RepID=A0A377K6V5_ECOLX|nr:Uncharacterised protein [Escherichia coli]